MYTVIDLLEIRAKDKFEKVAVEDQLNKITFGELHRSSQVVATYFRKIGLKKGDRVAISMSKSAEQIYVILGALLAHLVIVPILPGLKKDNVLHIINDSGTKLIVTDEKRFQDVKIDGLETVTIILFSKIFDHTNKENQEEKIYQALDSNIIPLDLAAIIYSSGSTGRPKGIMVTHRNLYDGSMIVANYLDINESDTIFGVLSFNFDYGLNQLWLVLATGCKIFLYEFLFPSECLGLISKSKSTILPLMPVIITKIFQKKIDDEQLKKLSFLSLRVVTSSGGRLSEKLIKDIQKTFSKVRIFSMYGLTEAFRSTYLSPEKINIKPGSIGKAIPTVEILVLDENGEECKVDEIGELVHRGGCITSGYWNDEIKTKERFKVHQRYPGEMLVFSGDYVYKDADGDIYFIGRRDGMLKNMGIRISPNEIENTIEKFQDIKNAIAFGIENESVGHDIVLAYTTYNGEEMDKLILKKFLVESLPRHMQPKFICHCSEFPTTGNQGKIDRVSVEGHVLETLSLGK